MEAGTAPADVLIAATHVDAHIFECLADCRAKLVRTFDDAKRALREQLYHLIVIDLNFDGVRTFDLLQYVRSMSDFESVPVLCVQTAEPGAGFSAALDRLVRSLGGRAFVDLRGDGEKSAQALQYLSQIADEVKTDHARKAPQANVAQRGLCVLVVDEDIDAAYALGGLVEDLGHDVDYAYAASAGLDAARRLRPDVIFLSEDLRLAGALRRESGCGGVFIIALAGAAAQDHGAGTDARVTQPLDPAHIKKLLASRQR